MEAQQRTLPPMPNKADIYSPKHSIAVLFWVISQESPRTPHVNVTREDAKPLPLTPAGIMLRRRTEAFHIMKLHISLDHCRPDPLPLRCFSVPISAQKEFGAGDRFLPTLPAVPNHCHIPTTLQLEAFHWKSTLPPIAFYLSQNKGMHRSTPTSTQ